MTLPLTIDFDMGSVIGVIVLEKTNQDNNGVTYYKKHSDGSELKLRVTRSTQGSVASGQRNRVVADWTYTTFPDGVPEVLQSYTHMIVPRHLPLGDMYVFALESLTETSAISGALLDGEV